jgi:hypothetical protein
MHTGLIGRRKHALGRLEQQLITNQKPLESARLQAGEKVMQDLSENDQKRIKTEVKILHDRLNGTKKAVKRKNTEGTGNNSKEDRWLIDIYSVNYGYVKNSERRKNKGKSKKKLKKVKTVSLLRTVVAQNGMITAYKEGRMGLSPKSHAFKLRRDIPVYF